MKKIKEFLSDYYGTGMSILMLLLLFSMFFKPDIVYDFYFYFTLLTRILFPFVAFFLGNKGIWWFFYITAIVNTLDISFNDFTAISVISILVLFIPERNVKSKVAVFTSYIICIFVVATLHQKEPYHLFVHFIGCLILYLNVYKLKHRNENKMRLHIDLELTNDEVIIIEELLKGKQQKEIEMFSQNTVTNKLKNARERNGLKTTDELLELYKK